MEVSECARKCAWWGLAGATAPYVIGGLRGPSALAAAAVAGPAFAAADYYVCTRCVLAFELQGV